MPEITEPANQTVTFTRREVDDLVEYLKSLQTGNHTLHVPPRTLNPSNLVWDLEDKIRRQCGK